MSDLPAPPPGFELDAPGVAKQSVAASPQAAPAGPAPPPGFEIDKAPVENFPTPTILPVTKGDKGTVRMAMPQVAKDLVDAISLPGRAAKGEDVSMDELINAAGFVSPGVATARGAKVFKEGATGPSVIGVPSPTQAIPARTAKALKNDGLLPEQVAPKLAELGPDGVLADLGPNLRGQAAAVATTPGAGQKVVVDKLKERQAGAPDRVRAELDATLGEAPVPSLVDADLKASQKALSPEYTTALAGAKPVDTAALAKSLDDAIASPGLLGDALAALTKARGYLNKKGEAPAADPASIIAAEMDPAKRRDLVRRHLAGEPLVPTTPLETDPAALLAARRAIGGTLDATKDGDVTRVLSKAKQDINDLLTASVPGIAEIDAKHGSLAEARKNVDVGQKALDSDRTSPRPVELQAKMDAANQPVGTETGPTVQARALSQGARAEIDRIVGTNLNDRAALNGLLKGQGDWNYDRLSTLFGKDKTDRIYQFLENERAKAETENLALSNSKTAAVTAAQAEAGAPVKKPGVLQSAGDLHGGTAVAKVWDRLTGGMAEKRQSSMNDEIANVIMGNGGLKSDARGQTAMTPAMLNAIMRQDPGKAAVDAERLRRMQNDRVY